MTVEVGVAVLASGRAQPDTLDALDEIAQTLDGMLDDFNAYRQTDVRLHVGIAQATGNPRLVTVMTEVHGVMTELVEMIPHPPEVLASANAQHSRLLAAIRRRDELAAATEMIEHVRATEHVLAGLLPGE